MRLKQIEEDSRVKISDTGLVYKNGNKVKEHIINSGYKEVSLGKYNYLIHRLVAKYFCSRYEKGLVVNHKDGNKLNNNYYNLEWCTYSYNSKDAVKRGTLEAKTARSVLKSKQIVPVIQLDKTTHEKLNIFSSTLEASKATGISSSHISQVCSATPDNRGYIRHSAGGYVWKYLDKEHKSMTKAKPIVIKYKNKLYKFSSYSQASKFVGCNKVTLSQHVKNKTPIIKNDYMIILD